MSLIEVFPIWAKKEIVKMIHCINLKFLKYACLDMREKVKRAVNERTRERQTEKDGEREAAAVRLDDLSSSCCAPHPTPTTTQLPSLCQLAFEVGLQIHKA